MALNIQELSNDYPFSKIGVTGFEGSGKTYTSALIMAGIYRYTNQEKPILLFDTENSSRFLNDFFKDLKVEVKVVKSRSLTDLNEAIELVNKGDFDSLMIDSISHVWSHLQDSYKEERGKKDLSMYDWGQITPIWKKKFSSPFVESRGHILFTGRAGNEYENEINQDSQKREIFKSGTKLKAQNETGYEADLLLLMSTQTKNTESKTKKSTSYRECFVLKDRTNKIDGKIFKNPTFEDFLPFFETVLNGEYRPINYKLSSSDNFKYLKKYEERKNYGEKKDLLLEEIKACFLKMELGTSTKDKALKVKILETVLGGKTAKHMEKLRVDDLEKGSTIIDRVANEKLHYEKNIIPEGSKFNYDLFYEVVDAVNNKIHKPDELGQILLEIYSGSIE